MASVKLNSIKKPCANYKLSDFLDVYKCNKNIKISPNNYFYASKCKKRPFNSKQKLPVKCKRSLVELIAATSPHSV